MDRPARASRGTLALLKLEFVRRFQLGLQRAYFASRGRQHEAAARRTLGWARSPWASARRGERQPRAVRRARHPSARRRDPRAALDLEEVRTAVAEGSSEALDAFVATLHEQLALEHRQFLAGGDSIRAAPTNLETTLQDVKRGGAAAPSAEGRREQPSSGRPARASPTSHDLAARSRARHSRQLRGRRLLSPRRLGLFQNATTCERWRIIQPAQSGPQRCNHLISDRR